MFVLPVVFRAVTCSQDAVAPVAVCGGEPEPSTPISQGKMVIGDRLCCVFEMRDHFGPAEAESTVPGELTSKCGAGA